jgi:hypothetical protein
MDPLDCHSRDETTAIVRSDLAVGLARGVGRMLGHHGYSWMTEFTLRSGRRVDVIGLDAKGRIVVVEVKSSIEDFRSDLKWPEYLDFCDAFYFAVAEDFPTAILPDDTGLIVADSFTAAILREAPPLTLNASRRKALILQFAQVAGRRLVTFTDPK